MLVVAKDESVSWSKINYDGHKQCRSFALCMDHLAEKYDFLVNMNIHVARYGEKSNVHNECMGKLYTSKTEIKNCQSRAFKYM